MKIYQVVGERWYGDGEIPYVVRTFESKADAEMLIEAYTKYLQGINDGDSDISSGLIIEEHDVIEACNLEWLDNFNFDEIF